MAHTQKRRTFENFVRHLENNGGPLLALIALVAFIVYLVFAHFYPNAVVVKTLQAHGSAAQVVSIAVVLLVALSLWGVEKMLFKIAEREQLRNRNAELEARNSELEARFAYLEARIAELEARDAEKTARIAELENQRAQPNEAERH